MREGAAKGSHAATHGFSVYKEINRLMSNNREAVYRRFAIHSPLARTSTDTFIYIWAESFSSETDPFPVRRRSFVPPWLIVPWTRLSKPPEPIFNGKSLRNVA